MDKAHFLRLLILPIAISLSFPVMFGPTQNAYAVPITYTATLNGPSEAPPNSSPGIGSAIVVIDTATHLLSVSATFSGLTGNTTASHIHCCTSTPDVGTVGVATQLPSFVGFPLGVTSGTFSNTFDLTLVGSWSPAFITNTGGSPASAEAALAAGLQGSRAYFNIHTSQFPGGEIRGFLQTVPEPAAMLLLGSGLLGLLGLRRKFSK